MTFEEMVALEAQKPKRKQHHNDEEHRLQCSLVNWFRLQYPKMQHNLFAVPNAGRRSLRLGKYMKDEGLLPGVADLILLRSNTHYGALLIEVKTQKGTQQKTQKEWQAKIEKDGYKYVIVRSIEDFMKEIKSYLEDT